MAHRLRPVRLKCRAKLRIHARHRSPTTGQAKAAETNHFTEAEVSKTRAHFDSYELIEANLESNPMLEARLFRPRRIVRRYAGRSPS